MTMSMRRRVELLEWAKAHGAAILEDDYDSDFHHDPGVIPLHALDHEQSVIYVGSFSKSLSPVLRLGFIVAPPSLQPAIHIAKQLMDWHANLPLQGALAEFLDSGGFARHVRRMRGIFARRSKALIRAPKEHLYNEVEILPERSACTYVFSPDLLEDPEWRLRRVNPLLAAYACRSSPSSVSSRILRSGSSSATACSTRPRSEKACGASPATFSCPAPAPPDGRCRYARPRRLGGVNMSYRAPRRCRQQCVP